MSKKILLQISILLVCILSIQGQQYPSFTQFSFNKFVTNPAAAGIDGFSTVSLIAREQWVGIAGTPKTHTITFDTRILGDSYILQKLPLRRRSPRKTRSGNTALGGYLVNDANGPINRTWLNGSYAYHIDLGEQQLSYGLSLLMFQNRLDADQINMYSDQIDPLVGEGKQSFWIFDANFGVFLTSRDYYAGYSTVQLFNSSALFGIEQDAVYKLERQHVLTGGYKFYVNNHIDLETSMLLKVPETFKAQLDLSAKATFDKRYWGGLSFKTGSAMAVFGGLTYDRYYFGYAFEYNFNSLAKQSLATHELIVIGRFGDAARRYKWLNSY